MKITLVPSSIPAAGEGPSQYLISYLINDTIAVDAGSLGLYGTPETQAKIKHVLVSHTHIDHTATLPIFIENAYEAKADCVTVHGSAVVLDTLTRDMFNNRTWPDFVALSHGHAPFLKLSPLEAGRPIELEGLTIRPIAVNHLVPTLGFLIEDATTAIVIASDTAPTEELWRVAGASERLKAVFLEASFPNAQADLAALSMHLTPALFGGGPEAHPARDHHRGPSQGAVPGADHSRASGAQPAQPRHRRVWPGLPMVTAPPHTRWRATATALCVVVALGLLHDWAIWIGIGKLKGLANPWPLWHDDHPLYFHSALATRSFLRATGTTAGYDPSFMAGYPKSVIWPSSSTLPELIVAGCGGAHPERAYKAYVLVSIALLPWLIALAGALRRVRPAAIAWGVALFLIYVWTDAPIGLAAIGGLAALGMVPYLLAIPLGLVATAAYCRYLDAGGFGRWLVATLLMALAVLVHLTSAMIVVPAAALAYLAAVVRRPETDGPFPASRHCGVWSIPGLVLAVNAFWWLPGIWLAATKGPSGFAFTHSSESVLTRLAQIVVFEPPIQIVLWAVGLVGLAALARRARLPTVGLGSFIAAGLFWGYLAGGFPSLDFLQPGRHSYACYSGLALAAGFGLTHGLDRLKGRRQGWLAGLATLGILLVGFRFFAPLLVGAVRIQLRSGATFLTSRPSQRLLWVVDRVRRHVKPGERLLYEEGGFAIREAPDPFHGGRFSGLLPWKTGVEVIGGPYLHASLTTNFTQFGEGKLFGKADWDRDHFVRYARLYRPAAILCWSPHARAFCRNHPDLIEVRDDDGTLLIGRVLGFEGNAIVGSATVEAQPGRLTVRAETAGPDGWTVLRYHAVPCLQADPPVDWEPVYLEDDPVPFISLRPGPQPVTFQLRFPPNRTESGLTRPLVSRRNTGPP